MPDRPSSIILLRHAEKPGSPATDADEDGIHLSTPGQIRAAALSIYIPANLPQIDYLFASKQSRHSNRSVETSTPLSQKLELPIDSSFSDSDFGPLAELLLGNSRYTNKVILICWHHTRIRDLAAALGVIRPPVWASQTFDRIWMIDYSDGTASFHNNPQMLLYGDSSV
jgi:hypothetical protein